MKKPKNVKFGDKIQLYEFRTGETKEVEAISKSLYNSDWDTYEVDILFPNGDKWYAIWDSKMNRWESGEI